MSLVGRADPCARFCVHGECKVIYDNGVPTSGECLCPLGFFGTDCGDTVATRFSFAWSFINWSLAVVYLIIAAVALFQFILLLCQGRHSRSYRKVMIVTVMAAACIRFLWLVIDPFTYRGIFPDILESILYQVVPGLIATAFSFILAFWIKLVRVLVPYTLKFCNIRIEIILVVANLGIWILLLPEAILLNVLSRTYAPVIMNVYSIYLASYLLILAVGYLTIGLTIYYYYVHPIGMAKMNNHMITKTTIMAVMSSVILLLAVVVILLGSAFALDYASSVVKFFVFQTIYRGVEIVFSVVVLTLAGDWDRKAWGQLRSFRKRSTVYGALSVDIVDSAGEAEDWQE